jgi:hypothetical protein
VDKFVKTVRANSRGTFVREQKSTPCAVDGRACPQKQKWTGPFSLIYLGDTKAQIQAPAITIPYIVSV